MIQGAPRRLGSQLHGGVGGGLALHYLAGPDQYRRGVRQLVPIRHISLQAKIAGEGVYQALATLSAAS